MKAFRRKWSNLAIRPVYVLIFAATIGAQAFLFHIDAFDLLHHWSREHEDWEVDEIFTTLSVLSFALIAVLIVRNKDVRQAESRRRAAEARASAFARFDALTGLANRQGFKEDVAAWLSVTGPAKLKFAVLLIDIDHFKIVNDRLGHAGGDEILRQSAARLRGLMGTDDRTAARIGGNEFAILTGALPGEEDAIRLARRVLAVLGLPIQREGPSTRVTVSIGIALFPSDGETGELLLQQAESALYQAKATGRNTYTLYDARHHAALHTQRETERALRDGLVRGEIMTHYQPIFDLRTGQPVSVEALARWDKPGHGLVAPGLFIPMAEDLGLIGDVFSQVLRAAADEAKHWPPGIPVAVNLSPLQLRKAGTAELILALLESTGLSPARLELEITESALLADFEPARHCILQLRSAGIHFGLDDFGTGYANLHQLRELPFDKVKIDRSFIQRLSNEDNATLAKLIIDLAHALRMTVVAEGIETELEADWARTHGCDHGQGYGLARPMPAAEIRRLLAPGPRKRTRP